jgi:hypothetical protein
MEETRSVSDQIVMLPAPMQYLSVWHNGYCACLRSRRLRVRNPAWILVKCRDERYKVAARVER